MIVVKGLPIDHSIMFLSQLRLNIFKIFSYHGEWFKYTFVPIKATCTSVHVSFSPLR